MNDNLQNYASVLKFFFSIVRLESFLCFINDFVTDDPVCSLQDK